MIIDKSCRKIWHAIPALCPLELLELLKAWKQLSGLRFFHHLMPKQVSMEKQQVLHQNLQVAALN